MGDFRLGLPGRLPGARGPRSLGLVLYAFLNARRQGLGEIDIPVDLPDEVPASWHAEVMAQTDVKPAKEPKNDKGTKPKK